MNHEVKKSPSILITATPMKDKVELGFSFDLNQCLDDISSAMLRVFMSWRETHHSDVNEGDAISQCMLQMMILKSRTLKSMLTGVPLLAEAPMGKKILDIPSLATIIRSIYELAFLFHNIFIQTDSNEEREILMYIWKIRGFNNRTNQEVPENLREKRDAEVKDINEYRRKAKHIADALNILEPAKQTLYKAIDSDSCMMSGFRMEKDDNDCIIRFYKVSFTQSNALFEHNHYAILYNYLSSLSHPSFLGVLQFGQMYNEDKDMDFSDSFLWIGCICMSKFIRDFCMTVSDGLKIKEEIIGNGWTTINLFGGL